MTVTRTAAWLSLSAAFCGSGVWLIWGQENPDFQVDYSECIFFGPKRDRFARTGLKNVRPADRFRLGELTGMVADALPARQAHVEADAAAQPDPTSTIDKYIFAAF